MILLETSNRILEEVIRQRIQSERREAVDITLADFDGVQFHVSTNPQQRNIVTVSMSWACANELKQHGAEQKLKAVYGPLVAPTERGYDFSLQFDLDNIPNEKRDTLPRIIGLVKRHFISAPFYKLFDAVAGRGGQCPMITINYRPNEAMYLKQEGDRAVVIFSINFRDSDDIVLSKVFLQEFANARKTISNAPAVTYSQKEAPGELRGVRGVHEGEDQGFVTFVLFNNHIMDSRKEGTIDQIHLFRNYLHYHIKCCKAYLHTRMRLRVESLLLVLNRAKMKKANKEAAGGAGEKKTITGRTFKRS